MDDIKIDPTPEHDEHDGHDGHDHAHAKRARKPVRFGQLLLQWARERRPKAAKPRKEMTEDELKAWKTERNRRRKSKAKAAKVANAVGEALGHRPPAPNNCRRRRLAAKHPERKWERK